MKEKKYAKIDKIIENGNCMFAGISKDQFRTNNC